MAYDLTIRGLHTYFVVTGDAEILVHNSPFECGKTILTKNGAFEPTDHAVIEFNDIYESLEYDDIVDALSTDVAENIYKDAFEGTITYYDPASGAVVVTDAVTENIITVWQLDRTEVYQWHS